MSLVLLRLSQKLRRRYSRRREVGRVSNVNRARSLENSFPRGKIIFVLAADRRFESRQMARTIPERELFARARYSYIWRKETVGKTAEVISDLISKPEGKAKKIHN